MRQKSAAQIFFTHSVTLLMLVNQQISLCATEASHTRRIDMFFLSQSKAALARSRFKLGGSLALHDIKMLSHLRRIIVARTVNPDYLKAFSSSLPEYLAAQILYRYGL